MDTFRRHGRRAQRRPFRPRASKKTLPALRPGADAKLKKIFDTIGTPAQRPFKADPFQINALATIEHDDCLVTAPTGAGKTWIALKAIERVLARGGKAWYASPLKALTNSKMAEFSAHFGAETVGILTGDRKENPQASVIVGTTEILRNQLYDAMHHGHPLKTDFVVLDEAHYLGDEDRGVVWEETLIYLPQRVPLLLLSATVGNDDQIAAWLTSVRGKNCRVVRETRRPVPLYPIFIKPDGTLLPLLVAGGRGAKARMYKKVRDQLASGRGQSLAMPGQLPPFDRILAILRKYNLLPAIFFLKSRADCDHALKLCLQNRIQDPDRALALKRRVGELVTQLPYVNRHRQRWVLEHMAVGSHHSGQLPAWKLVLETLMSQGLLDAIFATSTVAAGVDFPARTVAFLNSDRFNGREFVALDATELHQMTGRAGRRGKDRIGFALVVPGKYMDVAQVAKLFNEPPGAVHSQIRINFSMCLNLLLSHTPGQVKGLLHQSLASFQRQGRRLGGEQAAQAHLWHDFTRHLEFLKETGYVDQRERLTDDGRWASHLRIDQPLLVAEGLRLNLFPGNDPAVLAGLMASFVNEKETDEHLNKKRLPKVLTRTMSGVKRGLHGFMNHMQAHGFDTRTLYLKPMATVWAWASGRPWPDVVQASQMAEGDLVMLVLRTADNLRHLAGLNEVFERMASTARQAIELILRDPVMPDYGAGGLSVDR